MVDLPVIGIIKKDYPGTPMYITVTMKEVDELVECGVDILAVQGTGALRPDGSTSAQFIRAIKAKYPDQLVMADCDNFENAMACAEAGADFVGYVIVYLRDIADYQVVMRLCGERFGALPLVVVNAPVCRPQWLVEMECVAVKPIAAPQFPRF